MLLPIPQSSDTSSSSLPNTSDGLRSHVSNLFAGRSTFRRKLSDNAQERPKSPIPRFGLRLFESHDRVEDSPAMRSPTSTRSVIDPDSAPAHSAQSLRTRAETHSGFPSMAQVASRPHHGSSRRVHMPFVDRRGPSGGVVVEERAVRRNRYRRPHKTNLSRISIHEAFKNRVIRAKAIQCIVMGFALAATLVIYLVITATGSAAGQEFHVLLVLIILILTVFFCHSFIRFGMFLFRPPQLQHSSMDASRGNSTLGYMDPARPIPVVLARDEEVAMEGDEDAVKDGLRLPPPAYGLWRGSVRMNPNLVHWQRAQSSSEDEIAMNLRTECRPTTANRPPSYASDDGVTYVIEAQPRSTVSEQLPIHPSERGRIGPIPEFPDR